mgnify:CR=1 FL=1
MTIHPIFEDIIRKHNELIDTTTQKKPLAEDHTSVMAKKAVKAIPNFTLNSARKIMFLELGHSEGKILVNLQNVLHVMPWDDGSKITLANGNYLLVTDPYEELLIILDILNDSEEA